MLIIESSGEWRLGIVHAIYRAAARIV